MPHSQEFIARQAQFFKALGHPTRLLMVHTLMEGELCVADLTELAGADFSTISKHLSVLRTAGIVASEKKGNCVFYRIALPCLKPFLVCTGEAVCRQAEEELRAIAGSADSC